MGTYTLMADGKVQKTFWKSRHSFQQALDSFINGMAARISGLAGPSLRQQRAAETTDRPQLDYYLRDTSKSLLSGFELSRM